MKRPIVVFGVGYIIGIIWGLYCRNSIALLYLFIYTTILVKRKIFKSKKKKFKLISFSRYSRYLKLFINSSVIILIMISSTISNTIVIYLNQKYKKIYSEISEDIQIICTVISNKEEKDYKYVYKVKLEKIVRNTKNEINFKNVYLYVNTDKKENYNFEYGDRVFIKGEYQRPEVQRNYKGFDYSKYLKQEKVYGTIKVSNANVIAKNSYNKILENSNNCFLKIKENIERNFNGDVKDILLGITLGDTKSLKKEVKQNFRDSNISHVLAISGMHINFIILIMMFTLKSFIGKRKANIVVSAILIFYMLIIGFSPSIIRATVMGILLLFSNIFYRKNDIWTSIFFSLLIILIYNPFLIQNVGLQLSYFGTIGIILFNKNINYLLRRIPKRIREILSVTISAQIIILPIMIINFNTIGISFLITNMLVTLIIGPIVILGFLQIILFFVNDFFSHINSKILEFLIRILLYISQLGEKIPFSKIYLGTPNWLFIILYYLIVLILNEIYKIHISKKMTTTQIRVKNLINLFKYKVNQNKKKMISILLVICLSFTVFKIIPKDLKIYFVDVGQGDCCLIKTPSGKKILIDGGGSTLDKYTIGENTTLPYLLDRGITKLDYVIISHFDNDHVGGILVILKELKVENVIISKQYENSENYQEFLSLVKEKNISIKFVKSDDIIDIEKDLRLYILFPIEKQISNNPLNNNSIVFKLIYKEFSMIFTGDIEEIAEKSLVNLYGKNLKSDILKVAHHGSKSSSTQEFLNCVNPKVALIGVGKNNLYGHPNENVLNRTKKMRN